MSDYGIQLKNYGLELQNMGMKIQDIGNQIPFDNQNLGVQIQNMGIDISNIGIQIFNIGINLSNTFNMQYQMNNDMFDQIQKIKMMDQMEDSTNYTKNSNGIININFVDAQTKEKINIDASLDISIKELFDLFLKKENLVPNYLKKFIFLYKGYKLNPRDNISLLYKGIKPDSYIYICKPRNLIDGD